MRKASLNLSVNAIIIFVLAFAMLGVGIFVTNRLQDLGSGGLDKAEDIIKGIEEEPSADKPLVGITKDIDIPVKKSYPTGIKFYNKERDTIKDLYVDIPRCKDSTDGALIYEGANAPVTVVSQDIVELEAGDFAEIPFTITNANLGGGISYICRLELKGKVGASTTEEAVYTHSFYINVQS